MTTFEVPINYLNVLQLPYIFKLLWKSSFFHLNKENIKACEKNKKVKMIANQKTILQDQTKPSKFWTLFLGHSLALVFTKKQNITE